MVLFRPGIYVYEIRVRTWDFAQEPLASALRNPAGCNDDWWELREALQNSSAGFGRQRGYKLPSQPYFRIRIQVRNKLICLVSPVVYRYTIVYLGSTPTQSMYC